MKPVAYYRVSTGEQGDSGFGLDAQRQMVENWFTSKPEGYKDLPESYVEVASGKDLFKRGELGTVLKRLEAGHFDALIVAKLDRLSRSLLDLVTILELSRKQGWALIALDIGLDTSTPTGEAMFGMLAVWAQLERRMISQRTKDGLAAARAAGVRLGAPRTIPNHLREKAIELRGKNWSYEAIGRHVGLGWTTVRKMCLSENQ
jgi:DNA invertase Pin-like site-specific DNA recombinase